MHKIIKHALRGCDTVVELGCGFGVVLAQLIRSGHRAHGVDIFEPYLNYVPTVAPDATYECIDVRDWCQAQSNRSWDAVAMIDFIEHVPKDDGIAIIRHAQRIANRTVYIETPKGYLPQTAEMAEHIATPGVPDMLNVYQEHICGWSVVELEALGFTCTVAHKQRLSVTNDQAYDRVYATWIR